MKRKLLMQPAALVGSCCLAAGLAATPVSASGLPVLDSVHTVQNVLTQLHNGSLNLAEFQQQALRWAQQSAYNTSQLQHIVKQLIGVRRFGNLGELSRPEFEERAIDADLESRCGNSQSGISGVIAGVMGRMSGASNDSKAWQAELCARRVMAQNLRFNATVSLLQRLKQRSGQLEQLQSARDGVGDRPGELAGNDNDIARFMASTAQDLQEWQATMSAYDLYLQDLTELQKMATRTQLQGRNPIIGGLVQSAALKLALEKASRR